MGIVREYVKRKYGVNVSFPDPAVVVLGAAVPVQVLQGNPNRFSWTIQNMGAAIAYVSPLANVGALTGIGLAALGGLISFDADVDGVIPTRDVWAIGAGATTIIVYEVLGG
jgi:hypothetical protein